MSPQTKTQASAEPGIFDLDCSATVYPFLATKKVAQIFRMALELDTQIDPDLLRRIVKKMPRRFPAMFVNLRRDKDTYRLETTSDPESMICPEPEVYCRPFSMENGCSLLRITYRQNRLGIEMFHSISDGSGGMVLLKTLAAEYYRALGEEIPCEFGVCDCSEPAKEAETQDSFRACYDPDIEGVSRAAKHAVQYKEKGPFTPWHQTEIRIPIDSLKTVTRAKNATITEYCAALYLDILRSTPDAKQSRKPVALSVPVNLRPVFNSGTFRNFSLYFIATLPQDKENPTFDDILNNVRRQLKEGTDPELLKRMIHQNVSQADLPVFVRSPRAVKKAILRIGAALYGEGLYSSTFSNLGIFRLPEPLAGHVLDFHAMLGESPVNHIKILSYCYNGL
ncbi:MAG: hypothetical protein IJU45_06155, partial [Clostridia bacterium]|nr:hypothetical protein [Clostridia bacterium]